MLAAHARVEGELMPISLSSIAVVVFDLDSWGHPVRVWETFPDGDGGDAIDEAKALGSGHAGVLVWKRENRPSVGEEDEASIVFQFGDVGDFD